jgi:hypothetical protein
MNDDLLSLWGQWSEHRPGPAFTSAGTREFSGPNAGR